MVVKGAFTFVLSDSKFRLKTRTIGSTWDMLEVQDRSMKLVMLVHATLQNEAQACVL